MMRVVLGEAPEPRPGPVQLALLGAGIRVVGHATNLAELERVLKGVEPDAVVLDYFMGAMAVLQVQESCPASAIVVVWPEGVSGQMADERVDPARIFQELGPAIKRAVAKPSRRVHSMIEPAISLHLLKADGAEAPEPIEEEEPVQVEVAAPIALPAADGQPRRPLMPILAAAASFVMLVVFALALGRTPAFNIAVSPTPSQTPKPGSNPGGNGPGPGSQTTNPPLTAPPASIASFDAFFIRATGTLPSGGGTAPGSTGGNGSGGSPNPPPSHSDHGSSGPPWGVASHGKPADPGRPTNPGHSGQHGNHYGSSGNPGHHNGPPDPHGHGHNQAGGNGHH